MPDSAPLISAVREEGGEVIGKGVVPSPNIKPEWPGREEVVI